MPHPYSIVMDMDGTLLNDEKKISPKTFESLMRAQKMGNRLVLASGRPINGIYPYAKELRMAEYGGAIVAYNGALVEDCASGETLFSQPLPIPTAQAILRHLEPFHLMPMVVKGSYLYVEDVYHNMIRLPDGSEKNIIRYESRSCDSLLCEVCNLADFADFPIHKILLAGDPDALAQNYEAIRAPFKDSVHIVFSAPFYLEFTDEGIDKTKALSVLLDKWDTPRDHVIAFGDGHNDRTMIEFAGTGVAMDNAEDALKKAADHQTLSNNHDGIAAFLDPFLGDGARS